MFGAQKKIDEAVEQLEERMKSLLESKINALEKKIAVLPFPSLKDEIKGVRQHLVDEQGSLQKRMSLSIADVQDETKKDHATALQQIEATRKDADSSLTEVQDLIETYHAIHIESVENAQRKAQDGVDANGMRIDELHKAICGTKASVDALSGKHDELISRQDAILLDFDQLRELLHTTVQNVETTRTEFLAEKAAQLEMITCEIPQKIEDLHRKIEEECTASISALNTSLESTVSEINALQSTHARRLQWVIPNFREKLHHMLTQNSTLWSPEFSVLGQPFGRINLKVHPIRGEDQPMSDASSMPVPGLLNIDLWFPVGRKMQYKLTVGSTTRLLEHSFDGESGRACCSCVNFCNLDQIWDRRKDNIMVQLEILDLRATEERLAIVHAPSEATQAICNAGQSENMHSFLHVASEASFAEKLNKQLASIKSRWVRQVEWEIRGMNDLMEKTAAGDSMDSPIFAASGIDRMRLVFYPKGVKGGASGYCGLFLACPEDARMKFALSIGKQRRVLEHVFCDHQGSSGDLCGKAKFCNLEHQLEDRAHPGRERIAIVLELLEVELLAQTKHGDNVILRRLDPAAVEELKKVVSLPSVDARHVKITAGNSPKGRTRDQMTAETDLRPQTTPGPAVRERPKAALTKAGMDSRERGSSVGR